VYILLGSSAVLMSLRNVQASEQELPGILFFRQGLLMFAALNVDAMVKSSLPHCGLFP
jgi:hypothetical protein